MSAVLIPRLPHERAVNPARLSVFDRIFAGLAGQGPRPERIMIDATHLKAHRTAACLQHGIAFGKFTNAGVEATAVVARHSCRNLQNLR